MRLLAPLMPLLLLITLTILLPLTGALLGGQPVAELLRLPLTERLWDPLPPSTTATLILGALAMILYVAIALLSRPRTRPGPSHETRTGAPVPRYAWFAVFALVVAVMAVDGGAVNLAGGAITLAVALLANADTQRRTGNSLLRQRPGYVASLALASLVVGWAFYWLNLYLQLWRYPDAVEAAPFVLGKSLDYAVLLPALMSLRQWLASFPRLLGWTTRARPLPLTAEPREGWLPIGIAALALLAAPLWPDSVYPLTLAAPLLLASGLQVVRGRPTLLAGLAAGDWSRILLPGAAALLLGLLAQACNRLLGPAWVFELPLVGGPHLLGLPLPAWALIPLLGLLGVWVADQLTDPWKQRPQQATYRPRFPIKVTVEDLLGPRKR
jgi:hypothetical protein